MTDSLCDVIVESDLRAQVTIDALAQVACNSTFAELGLVPTGYSVALLACDDATISKLNNDFREISKATNVLSWPSEDRATNVLPQPGTAEDPNELGDIAIAYETCEREAIAQGKALDDHITHLIVHAILHLFGYDHEEDADATLMEATEVAILTRLGINDPYVDWSQDET